VITANKRSEQQNENNTPNLVNFRYIKRDRIVTSCRQMSECRIWKDISNCSRAIASYSLRWFPIWRLSALMTFDLALQRVSRCELCTRGH